MNGLITVLAWLLITLTFTGTYRLASYLAAPDGEPNSVAAEFYPALIATTITVAFVVVFDFVILLVGVAVLALPGYLALNRDRIPSLPHIRGRVTGAGDRLAAGWRRLRGRVDESVTESTAEPRGSDQRPDLEGGQQSPDTPRER